MPVPSQDQESDQEGLLESVEGEELLRSLLLSSPRIFQPERQVEKDREPVSSADTHL